MFPIDHDLHIHSTLSTCCHDDQMTPAAILEYAVAHGYDTICLTNHLWDSAVPGASDWYRPQDVKHNLSVLPLPTAKGVRFLFGCEAEYCGGAVFSLAPQNFNLFDFIIIPINHMHMKGLVRPVEVDTPDAMAELFTRRAEELLALPLPFEKIGLAHLNTDLLFRESGAASVLRLVDKARWRDIFRKAADKGAGIELNASSFRAPSDEALAIFIDFFALARDAGCRFYLGSDAHKRESLDIACLTRALDALGLTSAQRYRVPISK